MSFRLTQFHENERLLTWAQGIAGQAVVWATGSALLLWLGAELLVLAAFTAVLLVPSGRRLFLSIAAAAVVMGRVSEHSMPLPETFVTVSWLSPALAVMLGLGGLYLAFLAAKQMARWPALAQKHPVLTVHAAIWLSLWFGAWPGLGVLGVAGYFAWRLSYMTAFASRGGLADTHFRDHLFYLVPVYGGTTTPYAKGLDFLSRHEAMDPASRVRSQLAGVKLLLLAVLWIFARELLDAVIFEAPLERMSAWSTASFLNSVTLAWPRLPEILATGEHPAWYQGWAIVYLELIRATLALAAMGHVIVGTLRLMGFNVFRNTYKPLLSESVVEFWGRYYYYFKELLVDFFFYPTYLRLRGLAPSIRLFAAVFAAAFLGNMYHHLLARPEDVVTFDVAGLWATWSPRLVYCFLLAFGIWVSMLRQQKLRVAGEAAGRIVRLRRIAGVWTYYGIIHIWNVSGPGTSITDGAAFLVSLFGFETTR